MLPRRPGATCPSGDHLVSRPQASVPRPVKSSFHPCGVQHPSLFPTDSAWRWLCWAHAISNRNRNTRSSWSSGRTKKAPRHTRHAHRLHAHRCIISSIRPCSGPMAAISHPRHFPRSFHGHRGVPWPFMWPRSARPPMSMGVSSLSMTPQSTRSPTRSGSTGLVLKT